MRENPNLPWWLRQNIEIIGFEEDNDDSEEEEDEDEDSDEEEDSENEDSDEEDEDEGENDDEEEEDSSSNIDGLKSALRKERMARKKAERDLKKLRKSTTKSSEKDDEGEDTSSAADDKSERLAAALRDQAINNLIRKHASNFADVEDAVKFIARDEIDVDQDEDDPSVIEVDEDSVKDAVKALAKKKKYLLKPSGSGSTKSGSKFGGKTKKKNEISKDELRKKYSALRR